jgi:hypothetical protein
MVVMMKYFKDKAIDINIMEMEDELKSKKILLIKEGGTKMYSFTHWARTELQKMNPKNQNTMYDYLIRNGKSQKLPVSDSLPIEKPALHELRSYKWYDLRWMYEIPASYLSASSCSIFN